MGFITTIRDAIGLGPKGPVYGLDDLVYSNDQYKLHVEKAREYLFSTLYEKPFRLLAKDKCGATELLSDVRWKYLPAIKSWVDGEFIPKFRAFRKAKSPARTYSMPFSTDRFACDLDGQPLCNGISHFEASKPFGRDVSEMIQFFLCDCERSPFEMRRSLEDGKCQPTEIVRWYVNGLCIVRNNMKRIEDNLARYIDFAKSNMRGP